jgi:hypothetical protein
MCQTNAKTYLFDHQKLEAAVQGLSFEPVGRQLDVFGSSTWGIATHSLDLNTLMGLGHSKVAPRYPSGNLNEQCEKLVDNAHLVKF